MSRQRRLIALVAVIALAAAAACGSSDDEGESSTTTATEDTPTSTPTTETTESATSTEAPATSAAPADGATADVQITTVDLTTGTVTLTNASEADVDLGGRWLCNRPAYVEVPAQTIGAGESVDVVLGDFSPDGGEAALYTSNSFGDATAIVDYVHWGTGGGRADVAVEAAVWSGDPIPADAVGDQLVQDGGGSAAGWR